MSKIKELTELSRYLGPSSDKAYEAIMENKRFLPRKFQQVTHPILHNEEPFSNWEDKEEEEE